MELGEGPENSSARMQTFFAIETEKDATFKSGERISYKTTINLRKQLISIGFV